MDQHPQHDLEPLTDDLARLRVAFVNVYFAGAPSRLKPEAAASWVLVDAGLSLGAAQILEVAAARYGRDARPAAIVLTHGHFDHVGALQPLLGVWDVPVYAHPLELPFLTGRADYPPPDPTVDKPGLTARMSRFVPKRRLDLGDRVKPLPDDSSVPGMPGWRWIHTPGHAPGHVSLFRQSDRALLAGDAVVTTRQESVYGVATQVEELNGPPASFTIDWDLAERSVDTLAALKPALLGAGHGPSMGGDELPERLARLASEFDTRVRPRRGRYVDQPAITDESGVVSLPPSARSGGVRWGMLTGVAATAVAGTWLIRRFGQKAGER